MLPDWGLPVNQEALVVDQNIGHHQTDECEKEILRPYSRRSLDRYGRSGHDRLLNVLRGDDYYGPRRRRLQ
jgi:hypothetical protein